MRCCDKTTARGSYVLACLSLFDTKEKKKPNHRPSYCPTLQDGLMWEFRLKCTWAGSSDKASVPWRLDSGTTSAGIVCSVHLLPVIVLPSAWPHFVVAVFCDDAFYPQSVRVVSTYLACFYPRCFFCVYISVEQCAVFIFCLTFFLGGGSLK